jgi:hypothetical protein
MRRLGGKSMVKADVVEATRLSVRRRCHWLGGARLGHSGQSLVAMPCARISLHTQHASLKIKPPATKSTVCGSVCSCQAVSLRTFPSLVAADTIQ